MEAPDWSTESANSESLPAQELLILHTADAHEWATYLQQILKSSRKFQKRSILLYTLGPSDQLHGYQFGFLQRCKCFVLLLTGAFLDMLCDPELQGALRRLLFPPHKVVVLLCGVMEEDILTESFEDWLSWRKISAADEPAVYVSTILESMNDNRHAEAEQESTATAVAESHVPAASPCENSSPAETEEPVLEHQEEPDLKHEEPVTTESSSSVDISTSDLPMCLTVQPNRVLCRGQEKLFIIMAHRVQSVPVVEFSSEAVSPKRVPGTLENEYTISVTAPDMPAGLVSLTLYTDTCCIGLRPVTYYTTMGEVSRLLENATEPVNFLCQAFNLVSNATESLDNMLTDSLKSRMPSNTLQLFGIKQIEQDNMAAYQRDVEFPTLLHFAAKFGLKKLTTTLLQCPGALQAYSVMNKYGDYPNTLAEKSGFTDLRNFMDEFVETADMCHLEDSYNTEESEEVYEPMLNNSQDKVMKYSEDIYESMLDLDPECAEDLYEVMTAVQENPEEALLRKFFQDLGFDSASPGLSSFQPVLGGLTAKPRTCMTQYNEELGGENEEKDDHSNLEQIEEEEDPYNLFPEDIYDTVEADSMYSSGILNRPPAPIPRPESEREPEKPMTYICRVFSDKGASQRESMEMGGPEARPVAEPPSPTYDPYAGMKTPGQRQLISLQERVKVGEITVDEAVQEFKAWQFDHERRANSIRFQQENLKKLRDSITRRHKDKQKTGKELDYEISAPLQRNSCWSSSMTVECSVYEPTPRVMAAPPPPQTHVLQRGSWKTGSTSSTSSTESNRLSTHSTFSYSSGTEPDIEETPDLPPPPRPPRPSDAAAPTTAPRIPPRVPERVPEKLNDRYISCPTRAPPQRPTQRPSNAAPPLPRRLR